MNDFGGYSYEKEEIIQDNERTWAIVAHISPLIAGMVLVPPLGPLIVYLVQKEQSKFASEAALQALFFSIGTTLAIFALLIAGTLFMCCAGLGALLFPLIAIVGLVQLFYSIVGMVHASNNRYYEYPITKGFVPRSDKPLV